MGSTTIDRLAGVTASLASKAPVRAATTANISLSGAQTIDGVAVVAGDRVLVKSQTTGSENGIYIAASGAWVRAPDFDGTRDVVSGTFVVVAGGTAGEGTLWRITTADDITIGTTSIAFAIMTVDSASAFMITVLDDADAKAARATLDAMAKLGSVNVDEYGAVGDGSTDDATAIQAAIDALPTRGGTLFFGNKTYKFGTTININKRVHVIGQGHTQAVGDVSGTRLLKASTLNGNGFYVTSDACVLEGFHMRGESGNGGNGITVEAARVKLRDVTISHMGNDNLRIGQDGAGGNSNYWQLDNVYLSSATRFGLFIHDNDNNANAGVATNLLSKDNSDNGIRLQNSQSCTWINASSSSNSNVGILFLATADGHTFIGGNFESNTTDDIQFNDGSVENRLIGVAVDLANISDANTTNSTNTIIVKAMSMGPAVCHCAFNGTGTAAVYAGSDINIASIGVGATGIHDVLWAQDFKDTNYTMLVSAGEKSADTTFRNATCGNLAASQGHVRVTSDATTLVDATLVTVAAYGRQV